MSNRRIKQLSLLAISINANNNFFEGLLLDDANFLQINQKDALKFAP